ncbi:Inner membrane protein YbaN [Gammaproteobacteria bacterium]|nr:YbaN family protein [Gammaproteobacteria bacterium]QOJ33110.1 MAG: YbaN family protein [Gammaproteobacteria bacterium]CAG0942574.1 Inner membrane protein YbaN [Gammaproteobacteria bacterium]
MRAPVYRTLGVVALAIGLVGTVLPLLPTTPFLIGAAIFFARSNPEWERRLLAHPTAGPAIRAWIDHQAIPRFAKQAATLPLAASAIGGWFMLDGPWRYLPAACVTIALAWMWSRPSN